MIEARLIDADAGKAREIHLYESGAKLLALAAPKPKQPISKDEALAIVSRWSKEARKK